MSVKRAIGSRAVAQCVYGVTLGRGAALVMLPFLALCVLFASNASADAGLSGAIGFARAVGLIILAVLLVSAIPIYVWYRLVRRKWVWLFYPVFVALILGGLWAYQYT